MTNLDSILRSRDITLPTKFHLVKAMVFPVVMYECESWTIEKAERWRIDAFELWCWRRLLRVPWTAKRSNQITLKEISPEYSLDRLDCNWNSSTLAPWCEELTHWKRPWCWERLKAGGEGDDRGWDGWMASLSGWTWVWATSGFSDGIEKPGILQSMGPQRVGHNRATELIWYMCIYVHMLLLLSHFSHVRLCYTHKTHSFFFTKYYNSQFKLFHIILPLHMWIWHNLLI